jgi:hypothetical protein
VSPAVVQRLEVGGNRPGSQLNLLADQFSAGHIDALVAAGGSAGDDRQLRLGRPYADGSDGMCARLGQDSVVRKTAAADTPGTPARTDGDP